jgi:hypothetical protein
MLGATAGARTGTGSTLAPGFNPNATAGSPGGAVPAAYQTPVGGQSALGSLGGPPAGRSAGTAGVASTSDPFAQRGNYTPASSASTMGAARTSMPAGPGAYPSTGASGGYNPAASVQNPYAGQGMGMSGPSSMPNDRINVASRQAIGGDPSRNAPPANPGFGGYNPPTQSASRTASGDPFARPNGSQYGPPPGGPLASAGSLSGPPSAPDPYAGSSRSNTGSRASGTAPGTNYQGGNYPNNSPAAGGYPSNYNRGSDGLPSASSGVPPRNDSSGLRQGYSSAREPRVPGDTGYNPASAPAAPDDGGSYMPGGLRDTGRVPSASNSSRMPATPSLDSTDSGINPTSYLDASSSTSYRR